MEINLKMRSTQFEGVIRAWAQRSIRLLVPPGFATPIEVVVCRRGNFVCRTELASGVRHRRQGELHIFSLGRESGTPPRQMLHLRSEEAMVVIDAGTTDL